MVDTPAKLKLAINANTAIIEMRKILFINVRFKRLINVLFNSYVKKLQTSAMKDNFQIAECSYLLLQS